jgi:serine/threonine protein kinase
VSSPPPPPSHSDNTIAGDVLSATNGHGGFSTIKLAAAPCGGTVAVKIVGHTVFNALPPRKQAGQRFRLWHEAHVWVSLSHKHILPFFDCHLTPNATSRSIVLQDRCLIFLKKKGHLRWNTAGCMSRQVVKALRYLHEIMELVHGDVKLDRAF